MLGLLAVRKPVATVIAAPKDAASYAEHLTEYRQMAAAVGVAPVNLKVEELKAILTRLDIPVYNLREVIKYMDMKAAKESQGGEGWCWRPLRQADSDRIRKGWGVQGRQTSGGRVMVPQSNWYEGRFSAYEHIVPLHALQRVFKIEEAYHANNGIKSDIPSFVVSDYALKLEVEQPDPFLMVVVPGAQARGHIVIDFWDEPGFGIEKMLK